MADTGANELLFGSKSKDFWSKKPDEEISIIRNQFPQLRGIDDKVMQHWLSQKRQQAEQRGVFRATPARVSPAGIPPAAPTPTRMPPKQAADFAQSVWEHPETREPPAANAIRSTPPPTRMSAFNLLSVKGDHPITQMFGDVPANLVSVMEDEARGFKNPAQARVSMFQALVSPQGKAGEEANKEVGQFAAGMMGGLANFGISLTSSENLKLLATMEGAKQLTKALGGKYIKTAWILKNIIQRGAHGYFSLKMLEGAAKDIPEIKAALERGDYVGAGDAFSKSVAELYTGLEPAVKGAAGKIRGKTAKEPAVATNKPFEANTKPEIDAEIDRILDIREDVDDPSIRHSLDARLAELQERIYQIDKIKAPGRPVGEQGTARDPSIFPTTPIPPKPRIAATGEVGKTGEYFGELGKPAGIREVPAEPKPPTSRETPPDLKGTRPDLPREPLPANLPPGTATPPTAPPPPARTNPMPWPSYANWKAANLTKSGVAYVDNATKQRLTETQAYTRYQQENSGPRPQVPPAPWDQPAPPGAPPPQAPRRGGPPTAPSPPGEPPTAPTGGEPPVAPTTPRPRQRREGVPTSPVPEPKVTAPPPPPAPIEPPKPPAPVAPPPPAPVAAPVPEVKATQEMVSAIGEAVETGKKNNMTSIKVEALDNTGKPTGKSASIPVAEATPDRIKQVASSIGSSRLLRFTPEGGTGGSVRSWTKYLPMTETPAPLRTEAGESVTATATIAGYHPGTEFQVEGKSKEDPRMTVLKAPDGRRVHVTDADLKRKTSSGDQSDMSIQAARTSTGKIKLGADIGSLGQILGSSLYGKDPGPVIVKELTQNATDAIRHLPKGKGNVTIDLDPHSGTITVSDNGKGMSKKELETVFTDLGSSGKRGQIDAAGGFGLAKAAPLLMGEKVSVQTVVQERGGKLTRHIFEATPEELMSTGVEVMSMEVPPGTPTGTKVTTTLKNDGNAYTQVEQARGYVRDFNRSINPPGSITLNQSGLSYPLDPKPNMQLIHEEDVPGSAKISIYASDVPVGDLLTRAGISLPLEINNNGIYQFTKYQYGSAKEAFAGVPKTLAIDVKATVPEGDTGYPFAANRESLRGVLDNKIESIIEEKILKPAREKATKFIGAKYATLPRVASKTANIPIFDSGARMKPEEIKAIANNPDVVNMAEVIHNITNKTVDLLKGKINLGSRVANVGLVFSEKLHGVFVPDVATSGKKSTIFINPFSFGEGGVDEIASLVWHTIKHEIVHDKVSGHYESFTTMEANVAKALGARNELESILNIEEAYADRNTGQLRAGIAEAVRIYNESRRRQEVESDVFGGEALHTGEQQHPPVRQNQAGSDIRPSGGGAIPTTAAPPPARAE